MHNAQVFTQSWLHKLTGKETNVPVNQKADQQNDQGVPTDARWQQNSATVYVDINNTVLKSATETAISQWNNTGAFIFKPVANKKNADIIVLAVNDPDNGAAGLTNTSMNSITGYYLHATVKLNSYYLLNPVFGYSQQRIVNTAEHELGHAIGLQHTNKTSVMQPAGSYYPIQRLDIDDVKALYSRTPQPPSLQDNNDQSISK
ncbi:matrixin family metalloprotease [Limosilactobacillus rudii]|nr:matrixin family metalloprotease [Limosilactobacillus rudii]MCD7135116.1 matrixin family metalloprotease [Limosilactobacillus rudii]